MKRELRASRYLTPQTQDLSKFIVEDLPFLDFEQTMAFYEHVERTFDMEGGAGDNGRALLNANDRYYLLTITCNRHDAWHPWIFDRCREVEANPDGYLDLWARYHYKSSVGTFAGILQEVIRDPEIKIAILSCKGDVADPFLLQIQQEMETNDKLKRIHSDVFWQEPRKEAPLWNRSEGLIVKRKGNPKEATVEAHGLIDAMPTGRHFDLLVYDDLINEMLVGNPEMIKKATERWEMSDNLGSMGLTRKWHFGTRYSFGDTYGVMLERKVLKERRFPATDDGTLKGNPVLLSAERWNDVKNTQRSTVNAQMLLNPLAGNEATFRSTWFAHYDVIPSVLNVYIIADPSKGRGPRSDRTAIAVIGVDQGGNKYLLDGVRHRMKLTERWQFLKQFEERWRNHPGVQVCLVGYEQYGMQVDLEVIEDMQLNEGIEFGIQELNSSKDGSGKNAKNDRIERLEPDMKRGKFYLPAVVHHPDFNGSKGGALWDVWSEEDHKQFEEAGNPNNPSIGTILYRPMQGLTRQQRYCEVTLQAHRIVQPIKRRDERGDVYDVTRAFMEEAMFHPFGSHDDLIDAVSRIYDMNPTAPVVWETAAGEPTAHPDS